MSLLEKVYTARSEIKISKQRVLQAERKKQRGLWWWLVVGALGEAWFMAAVVLCYREGMAIVVVVTNGVPAMIFPVLWYCFWSCFVQWCKFAVDRAVFSCMQYKDQERALIEQIKRDTNFDELATVFFGPEWKTPLSNSTDETAKRLQESQTPNVSMQQSNLKGQQNTPEQPQSKPEKSVVARFLGLLVGTEVNNSYALICRHCSAHNGLALAEDFPNLNFTCRNCGKMNTAKERHTQLKLQQQMHTTEHSSSRLPCTL